MALNRAHGYFPFDVFDFRDLPGSLGEEIRELAEFSMFPPYPWGQWLYGRLIAENIPGIPGDFIELGVGKGGMSLFLGRQARAHARRMYSLDSFAGLPALHPEFDNRVFEQGDYGPGDGGATTRWKDRLLAKIDELGLGDTMTVIPGFFEETLARLPEAARFAFVHIDCDLYTSVRPVLDALYDRVSDGGFIVIDDFFHPAQGPLRAAVDFFNARRIFPLFHVSFPYTVVVRKGEQAEIDTSHFSVDGNLYSLDYLKQDPLLVDTVERCWERARRDQGAAEAAENARILLSLLKSDGRAKQSEIYGYWYALREFWNGFQDHRRQRPVYRL